MDERASRRARASPPGCPLRGGSTGREESCVRFGAIVRTLAGRARLHGRLGRRRAIAWPIIPDFVIFPLALAAPRRAPAFFVAALAGSLGGGLLAYLAGGSAMGPELLSAAPLVTDRMIDAAQSGLQADGAAGLLSQPLSGIPYKVFALQAEPAGLRLLDYVGMSALARGGRFLAVAIAAASGGVLLRRVWERFFAMFFVLYAIGFVVGLARAVGHWS